jgi:sterol desaturase/sphingolipid hydroxylase (fatty acid hydroxylase superfamily)
VIAWAEGWLGEAIPIALLSLLVLAVMFGPLERAFAARPEQRPWRAGSGVDLAFFFGQYLVWSALALLALDQVRVAVGGTFAPSWPLAVEVVAAVVLGDLLVYGWHRACHAVPVLWRFHAVHHTAERLDWLAAHREHPLDGVTTQLAQNLPAMVLGLSLGEVGALVVFRGMWGAFIHSNVRLDVGWLRFALGAPALHHHHHARDAARVMNFANLAPWIDVVFGTYERPTGPETYALGVPEPAPRGYLALLWWPFDSASWRSPSLRANGDQRGAYAPARNAARAARRSALPLPPMGSSATAQVAQRRGSL